MHSLVFAQMSWKTYTHQKKVVFEKKTLHMNVYGSFIHKSQNVEVTKMSFNIWIDKLVYLHNEILLSNKKKSAILALKDMQEP